MLVLFPGVSGLAENEIDVPLGKPVAERLIGVLNVPEVVEVRKAAAEAEAADFTYTDVNGGTIVGTDDTDVLTSYGVKLSDEGVKGWQSQIGYVPQHIYLIDESIKRNIAFGLDSDEIELVNHWVPESNLELHKQPLRESKLEQLGIK